MELFSILHELKVEKFTDSTIVDQTFCCLYRQVPLRNYTPQLQNPIQSQETILIELSPNYENSQVENYLISNITNFEGFSGHNPLVVITRLLKHQALNI